MCILPKRFPCHISLSTCVWGCSSASPRSHRRAARASYSEDSMNACVCLGDLHIARKQRKHHKGYSPGPLNKHAIFVLNKCCGTTQKITRDGTRTRNLLLTREAPYPLGHTSTCRCWWRYCMAVRPAIRNSRRYCYGACCDRTSFSQ